MIAETWEHITELFARVLECSPEQRQLFLVQLRQDDPAVADEIERLLASHEKAGDFLVQPCCISSDFLEDLEAEEQRFSPGDVLCGRFRIIALIGRGGMGEVYKAWDEELEDHVALKTLRLEISTHELFTSRFRREIQLARKVTHPNVCRIFDSFKHAVGDGTYISVLSMELLQGQNLAEDLKTKGRLAAAEALPVAQQIIAGLSAIHAAGIVHRDLKPSNLVLVPDGAVAKIIAKRLSPGGSTNGAPPAGVDSNTESPIAAPGKDAVVAPELRVDAKAIAASGGQKKTESFDSGPGEIRASTNHTSTRSPGFQIKITDFGIAGRLPDGLSPAVQTEVSKLMGTPDYMAPEQLEHARTSVQSDIYSLGLILYEMVTGAKPFADASAWKRTTADPPLARKLVADLPENWNKTIACCLERNPQYRFQSAQDAVDCLQGGASAAKIPPKPFLIQLKRAAKSKAGVLAIFFLLAMSLAAGGYRYYNQSPEIPAGTMILVTDITTPDPSLSGITVALKSQLEQSAHFEVEEDTKIGEILRQMDRKPEDPLDARTAREVARRSGAPLVVFGSVTKKDEGYELSIRLEHPINPFFPGVAGKQSFFGENLNELLNTAVHAASSWIRKVAGEQAAELDLQDRTVEDTTTPSWQALQQYGEAEKKYSAGDTDGALVLLAQAIQSDGDFAKAHMRRADILISLKRYNEGYAEWKTAFGLVTSRKLTNRESLRIQGQYFEDTGDYINAEKKFAEYKTSYPNDFLAWFYWGSTLNTANLHPSALVALNRAAELRPMSTSAHVHLGITYLLMGRSQDALSEIQVLTSLKQQEWASWLNAYAAFARGDYDAALTHASSLGASTSPDWRSRSLMLRAFILAELGRRNEALQILQEGSRFDHNQGLASDECDKLIAKAYLSFRLRDFTAARTDAIQAIKLDNNPQHLAQAGSILARMGEVGKALDLLDQLNKLPPNPRVMLASLRLQGEIDLNNRKIHAAIAHFKDASRLARPEESLEYLTRALIKAGKKHEAASLLATLVHNPLRLLLDRGNQVPGLWGDSLLEFIDMNFELGAFPCSESKEYINLRKNLDAPLEPSKTRDIQWFVNRNCHSEIDPQSLADQRRN